MQKDEIWELQPEGNDKEKSGGGGGETESSGKEEKPDVEKPAGPGGSDEEQKKPVKEPDRLDMDEILDLKPGAEKPSQEPAEEKPGAEKPSQEPGEEKPAQEDVSGKKPSGEKDRLELVDIGEKKPGAAGEEEGVVVKRQEEKKLSVEKPQVLDPGEKGKPKGPAAELKTDEFKKYERTPKVQGGGALPQKSGLLTVGLLVVFVFLAASTAILALPFFGIDALPEELPVAGQLIDFYRGLPIFPD